jgi:hypothetical protein
MEEGLMGELCKLLIWKAVGKTDCDLAVIYIIIWLESRPN